MIDESGLCPGLEYPQAMDPCPDYDHHHNSKEWIHEGRKDACDVIRCKADLGTLEPPEAPKVFGADLSLTATGFAQAGATERFCFPKLKGMRRIDAIVDSIFHNRKIGLLVIEGPSYGSTGGSQHERAGLWWIVVREALSAGIEVAVAPPTTIKKFATGAGNADKDKMLLTTARRFDWFDGDNNEADALWACAIGHQLLGEPIVAMPVENVKVLEKVTWMA